MNSDLRPVDPAGFNDPLALRVEWKPLAKGSSRFPDHQLVERAAGRLEFAPNRWGPVAGVLSIVFGVLIGLGYFIFEPSDDLVWDLILPLAICLGFLAQGAVMLWSALAPRVFDRGTGSFWVGRMPPRRIAEIHALQIVGKRVRRSRGLSFTSYEINVVMRDGGRIHVLGHGDVEALRTDAKKLAQALGCKLWDATQD